MIANKNTKRREISFSDSFQTFTSGDRSQYSSPSIAYESKIPSFSRQKKMEQSPIHNLHYKYLPSSYKLSQLEEQSKDQAQKERVQQNYQKAGMMDQINKKIRNILSSIEEQEKRKEYYYEKYTINIPEVSQLQPFKLNSRVKCSSIESIGKKYVTPLKNDRKDQNSKKSVNQYSNMSSIESQHQHRTPLGELKQSQIDRSFKNRKSVENVRKGGKVAIDSLLKNDENKAELIVKGRDINSEIQKIQAKMQSLNKLKRDMKIDDSSLTLKSQPSAFKESESSVSLQKTQMSILLSNHPSEIDTKRCTKPIESNETSVQNSKVVESQYFQQKPNEVNCQEVDLPWILRKATEKKKKKQQMKPNPIQSSISQFQIGEDNAKIKTFFQNNPKEDKQMENSRQTSSSSRRKLLKGVIKSQKGSSILQETSKNDVQISESKGQNYEFKKFLRHISCQIKLDEYFRKAKQWFHKLKSPSKWNDLESSLFPKGQQKDNVIQVCQIKSFFSLVDQEQNPFYTPRDTDFSFVELTQAFNQCLTYWQTNIHFQYDFRQLIKGGFREDNIDLRNRGFVSMEDLSRFFNCQLDSYFRNRDIYLIYERLKRGDELYYEDIANHLQKK